MSIAEKLAKFDVKAGFTNQNKNIIKLLDDANFSDEIVFATNVKIEEDSNGKKTNNCLFIITEKSVLVVYPSNKNELMVTFSRAELNLFFLHETMLDKYLRVSDNNRTMLLWPITLSASKRESLIREAIKIVGEIAAPVDEINSSSEVKSLDLIKPEGRDQNTSELAAIVSKTSIKEEDFNKIAEICANTEVYTVSEYFQLKETEGRDYFRGREFSIVGIGGSFEKERLEGGLLSQMLDIGNMATICKLAAFSGPKDITVVDYTPWGESNVDKYADLHYGEYKIFVAKGKYVATSDSGFLFGKFELPGNRKHRLKGWDSSLDQELIVIDSEKDGDFCFEFSYLDIVYLMTNRVNAGRPRLVKVSEWVNDFNFTDQIRSEIMSIQVNGYVTFGREASRVYGIIYGKAAAAKDEPSIRFAVPDRCHAMLIEKLSLPSDFFVGVSAGAEPDEDAFDDDEDESVSEPNTEQYRAKLYFLTIPDDGDVSVSLVNIEKA